MTLSRSSGVQVAAVAGIGLYSAMFALLSSTSARLAWTLPVPIVALLWWTLSSPWRWVALLLASATLLPPLPIPLGDSGPHPALVVVAVGILIALARLAEWHISLDAVTASLCGLFLVLLGSVGTSLFFSGSAVAAGTLARVALFGIGVFVFLYTAHGPAPDAWSIRSPLRWLFAMAIVAAAFACLDFYYQFPAPAGFSAQFVWLDSGVFRRAQGLYYDASALGNFCAFFLVMVLVGLLSSTFQPLSKPFLIAGGTVLAAALMLSYSRASLLNIFASGIALAVVKRVRVKRIAVTVAVSTVAAVPAIWSLFPAFAEGYWVRLAASAQYFWTAPEGVLSGRVASWRLIVDFLISNPWSAVFGIGYKTLPYTSLLGQPVIPDNMYLSLLVETGILGLVALLLFSGAVIYTGYRATQDSRPETQFLGTWMACFWVGQMVQMLSGDLLTYWRVLPVYFWVLAIVVRLMKGNDSEDSFSRSI